MTNREVFNKALEDIEVLETIRYSLTVGSLISKTYRDQINITVNRAVERIRASIAFRFWNVIAYEFNSVENPILDVLMSSYLKNADEYKCAYDDVYIVRDGNGLTFRHTGATPANSYVYPEFAMVEYFCDKYNKWEDEEPQYNHEGDRSYAK